MSRTPALPGISAPTQPFPQIKLILVVEPDSDFGIILVQMIKQRTRYKPILANNGRNALKIARFFKCHLFLLDYQQPDMHGFELYDQLHTLKGYGETPALFLSGNAFLERPFTDLSGLEILLQTTRDMLNSENEGFTFLPTK
jgi:CheY-like chemotaxis protein